MNKHGERSSSFVKLDRRFRQVNLAGDQENTALSSYTSFSENDDNTQTWDDLLSYELVVILGEPGSGKTWELEEQARLLDQSGKFAFFVRLDTVLSQGVRKTFSPEELKKFDRWLKSRDVAIFLLDSVDESKILSHEGFGRALKLLRNEVSSALTRCNLIISSRISEWRPILDQHEVLRLFPHRTNKTEQASQEAEPVINPLKVVQIQPLDAKRVKLFAQSQGVKDVDSFLEALDINYAWEFARRPVDVTGLLNYWKSHGRLGTLTELIEHDINFKLSETRDLKFISAEQARQGAEMLAASVILCRQFNIKISDDAHVPDESGLSPALCLPESWTPDAIRALLSRAVFDSACYGHQRFHHRRTTEYLTASWLNKRMKDGCPLEVLEGVLFETARRRRIIRPSLAPITAWLASGNDPWNEHVREWILDAAPWLHLHLGDPAILPIDYKLALLQAIVNRFQERDWVMLDWSPDGLKRFADPELALDVSGFILDQGVAADLRADLLMLARHGRMQGCLGAALKITSSPDETESLKIFAAATIRDAGEVEHRKQLASIVEKWDTLSERLCCPISEALYPQAIDEQGLLSLLKKCESPINDSVGLRYYLEYHLKEVLLPERAGELLAGLIQFSQIAPLIKGSRLSQSNHWVTQLFHGVLLRLFERPCLNDKEIFVAVSALCLLEDGLEHTGYRHNLDNKEKDSLSAAVLRHQDVRQAYFWSAIEHWRESQQGDPLYAFQLFGHYSVLSLSAEDVLWLVSDIWQRDELRDKKIALRFALDFAWHHVSWSQRLNLLSLVRRAIKSTPELNPFFWSQTKSLAFQPVFAVWYNNFHRRLKDKYWWERKFRSVRQKVNNWRDKLLLLRRLAWLRNAERINWLVYLSRHVETHNRWAPEDFNALINEYGRPITRAFRRGCENFWHRYWPTLPHEKTQSNQTAGEVIVGLFGLQSLVMEQAIDFAALEHKEAERAARYALNELNGFSSWFPELAYKQPHAVKQVLAEAIEGEWQYSAERQHVHDVVSDLVWSGDYLWDLVSEKLGTCLRAGDPPHQEIFSSVLTLVFKTNALSRPEIAVLAQARIRDYELTSRHYCLWLNMWIQADAGGALSYLEKLLPKMSLPDADRLVLDLCGNLPLDRHGRYPKVDNPDYEKPEHLMRLIKLVYRHVRPSEDIVRTENGASPPISRDVQHFRSTLLEKLVSSNDPQADNVFQVLLKADELASEKDWLLHMFEKRTERLADGLPWREMNIREFASEYEIAPRMDYDLFKIACNRLSDIKREIEDSENSARAEVNKEWKETELRSWFQRKLRENSRNRYTIPQEAEIDMGKKPDLRFERAGIDGAVSVELKWSENWTYEQLIERLENQLVGQYLRAHNARYGIFLLGYIGRQSTWKGPGGDKLNFSSLIEAISSHAEMLQKTRPDIEGIKVIGINFVPPYGMLSVNA